MKTKDRRQSANVLDQPWLQQMTPEEMLSVVENPFGSTGIQTGEPSLKDMLYALFELIPADIAVRQRFVPRGVPDLPMDVETLAQRYQGLPFGGMGHQGMAAVDAARQANLTEMGQDRTRPWAETSHAGWAYGLPGQKDKVGASLNDPNFKGWQSTSFNPEWIKPSQAGQQGSPLAEALRQLFAWGQ